MIRCPYLEPKTEMSLAKAQGYIGGGHRTEKTYPGRGGHRTYFVDEGNNWGGEPSVAMWQYSNSVQGRGD